MPATPSTTLAIRDPGRATEGQAWDAGIQWCLFRAPIVRHAYGCHLTASYVATGSGLQASGAPATPVEVTSRSSHAHEREGFDESLRLC
jgi:hypothetical protein